MGESKAHLFVHDDMDGLPLLVFRLEGDDDQMVEVAIHDWRVAVQWAVVMQYGAASMADRCSADMTEVQEVYTATMEWLAREEG